MATDADIPLPVNEAREEQVGLPIVEGEHFLKSPSTDEVANNIAPNVSKLVEKTFAEKSQQNAEESISKDGDGNRGVVPEKCSTDPSVVTSDMKVGDTDDDPCTEGAIAVTQLSKETSSDHHGAYDSLTKEILVESSLPSKEAESHTPCISEGDHNVPKLVENSEESSPVRVEESQVVRDEHFKEESERLPLTEVSTGETNENIVLEATDNVKDKDKDLKEEQSRNDTLHGDTNKAEDATINANDGQKESVEGFPAIVSSSHKEGSINADLQEAMGDHKDGKISDEVDNHKEILENLSSGEGHCKLTNISPDISKDSEKTDQTLRDGSDTFVDRPVELAITEETHVKVIQRNAEEYNSTDKDGGRDVIPEVCSIDSSVATSETKVGDTLVYPDMDDTEVATKLPKYTSSDNHGINDSSTTDVALTEEILQEADLVSRETESRTPCISEGEEPNFQVKTIDNKSVDEKPTEEDIPCIIRNEVSKEGNSDHNKSTSEQDELENERSVENSTSGETIIALENSNANELQSKRDLNSSLSKEEEMDLQKSVEPVTTPEDYGVPSEKTLSESHGDVECKSKTMEDAATDHRNPKLVEKSEESSVVQVTNSQIDHNEDLGEDTEGLSLKEVSTGCTNDNASAATGEIKGQSEDDKEAELPENEQNTKCTLEKEDMQIENLAELHVALENNEVSNITQGHNAEVLPEEATSDVAEGQDSHENFPPIVSGSPEEGSVNTVLQEVTSDDTVDKIIHESDKHKEASENLLTTVSTEDTEGITLVKMEGSENKKKDDSEEEESEEPPLPLLLAQETSYASVQEARFEDGEPNKAEFYNDERDTENTEDVHVKPEDTKAPDLVDKRSEGGTVDAAAEREETVENVPTIVHLDEENEQVSSIKEPSGAELFEKDKNYESVLLMEEVQTIISDKITDTGEADKNDLALENVAIEESLVTQVDCSAREHEERVEEENQSSSLIEALVEETNARESKNTDEPKNSGKESMTPEMENEEHTENMYGKEETDVETPIDFLQVKPEDIKQHDPSPDKNKSIEEEITNADPLGISTDKAERESVDVAHAHEENVETKDVAKAIPDSDKKDSIPIEEFGSQNPMNEASSGNANGEKSTKVTEESLIMKEEPLESLQVADKDIETPPVCRDRDTSSLHEESPTTNPETIMDDNKEKMLYNATGEEDETSKDKGIVEDISDCGKDDNMPSEELVSQNPLNGASAGNANIEESTEIGKGGLINEEVSFESLQKAEQEIETDHLSRQREISSPDEQSHIVNLEGNGDDSKEEIAASETSLEGETLKDKKSIANTTPYEDKEDSMQVQEDCSQWEQNESENIPSSEAPALSSIESSPVKEEEKVEIPTKEQILTADPQETIDETQEKTIDAADKNNDVAISAQNGDSDDNSPVEVDGLQEPPSEEVPAEKINDDEPTTSHETKFAYENNVKANLNEDEEKTECALVKEDVNIESSQVADDDIKGTSSGHDREANPLDKQAPTTGSQETMDDEKYAKPLDSTDLKQEILEDGNCATTPDEDTKEDSKNQADDFILESEEQSVKDSESTSVSDTPKDDITESMLVKEVAKVEDPIDSSEVATEDTKAFAPRQDAESSIVEQILDPTTIENETPKDENVPTIFPDENLEEHLDEENEHVSSIKETSGAELSEKNENSESALLMEEVQREIPAENIKTSDFDQHTKEKGILEEKIPTETQRIPSDEEEETRIDAATTNEKTQELQNDLNENSNNDLLLKVAASELTHDINLEEEPERPPLTEISKMEAFENESILLEPKISDEPSTVEFPKDEKSTDYTAPKKENLQPEDHKTSTSSGDTETSCSLEEPSLEDNSQTIIRNKITDAGEADKNDLALEVPKEADSADVKEETKEEEGYIKAVEITNAVTVASNQMTSNEHVSDSTSLESVVLEKINDPIVGEANSFNDKTDLEKIPISETLAETASTECTETKDQLPNVEKEAEVSKREAENDQKHIKETLPNDAVSLDVLESKEVTGEEEVSSNRCKEISSSPISVASEDVSTSNVALEEDSTSNSVTDLETKNEEVPAIKEKTPSSVEGQDSESTIVEKTSNYAGSFTEKRSDSTEVAFTPGENKGGYESDKRSLESIAQGQIFNIMSETEETKAEEEDLNTESGIQSDKAVIEDIVQEETMYEKEIVKDDISSEKDQLSRIKEEHEDVKDYHQGFCELEVPEVSEEADDKAPEDQQEKTFTDKAIDRILHQEEQATRIEEPTTNIDDENVRELDIGVNTDTQDSNKETVQIAIIPGKESEEQNKEDEIYSSDKLQEEDEETLILSEGESKEEAKETYKEAYLEAEKFDSSPQIKDVLKCAVRDVGPDTQKDNEKSTTGIFSEEDYPKNITKCEVSSASEDVALTEQPSEDASITAELQEAKKIGECTEGTPLRTEDQLVKDIALAEQPSEDACITAEVQEAKAGIDLGAAVPVPGANGSESQEVENLNEKCTEMADTSTPVETLANSTSKNIGESTEGNLLEAEDQQTKLYDLPEESNMSVTEVKTAEKDDAVNIQSARSISEDVQDQELFKESYGVSSNHNPVQGNPEERTETSEGQKTNPIQAARVLETLKKEKEEQKLGGDNVDVHEEEKNTYSIPSQLESLNGADTEKVQESSIHQRLVEDTAQHEKKEGIQQIDSPLFLPHAQCSDITTSENEPAQDGGLGSTGVTELDASPLSLKDKHVDLESGDTSRNLIPENLDGDKNVSTEHFQGEHEVVKPSKVEQEEDECGNKERKDHQMERKTESEETDKASLSDQLHVSTRGTSEMADHSPTEKEPTRHTEDMPAQNIDEAQHENMKTDEEKDGEEESHEQKKSDLGSEAPVMVDIGDADIKVAHKKSHNILSGVGSKVKHSIAKVKKAITGKSPSPKKATIPESK
ncbi:microtubule-associated protein futsch-like isoform X2 [Salvia splendens]|uniref:microtubule-associated protein futsch-like isoform X2 n=1 Tax=Salvia splendens TaxID=180675 RepID=UPI001C280764|nr:microtubule-associated protein futsch-like isoform X2 [Salvia splendens]